MNKEELRELIDLMKEENMKVISIESEGLEIYLESFDDSKRSKALAKDEPKEKKDPYQGHQPQSSLMSTAGEIIDIKAEQIGTFYTQPEEDSDETFVSVGDSVSPGDQIGLIETMKIFNEVKVDDSGTIEEILVSNGEAVEYGQVIMRLRSEEA